MLLVLTLNGLRFRTINLRKKILIFPLIHGFPWLSYMLAGPIINVLGNCMKAHKRLNI